MVLSYDDGPSEYTDTLLDILSAQKQKATLCMVGRYQIYLINVTSIRLDS
jgi:hypothetical protein